MLNEFKNPIATSDPYFPHHYANMSSRSVPASLTITLPTPSTQGSPASAGVSGRPTASETTTSDKQAESTDAGNSAPGSVGVSSIITADPKGPNTKLRHVAEDLPPYNPWNDGGLFIDPEEPDNFLPPIVPGANVTTEHVAPTLTAPINDIPSTAAQGQLKVPPFAMAAAVGGVAAAAAAAAAIGGVPR